MNIPGVADNNESLGITGDPEKPEIFWGKATFTNGLRTVTTVT